MVALACSAAPVWDPSVAHGPGQGDVVAEWLRHRALSTHERAGRGLVDWDFKAPAKSQTRPEPRETEGIATDSRDREQGKRSVPWRGQARSGTGSPREWAVKASTR
jgi:hypothetical protein